MAMASGEEVYCTLVLTDSYLPGAAVLAHSLRDACAKRKLACLISQESLRASTVKELQSLYDYVITIDLIGNPHPANLYLMSRPDLLYTFSKINLWRQTQFRKIVYIDADVVALRAPDELFDIPDTFAAAPDVGWPDIFNTGVMVLAPHMGDFSALRTLASAGDSFDGADQGLLNQFYEHKPWKRLNFSYNVTPSGSYQYEPAYRYFKRDISMVHFIGNQKPWQQGRSAPSSGGSYQELLSRWWAVYDRHFKVSTHDYISTGVRDPQLHAVQYDIKGEHAEKIDQRHEPTSIAEHKIFAAPHIEWDATRSAPPLASEPEAANFPTRTYEFNTNPEPFRPPHSYPHPPKDIWYELPKDKPTIQTKPATIFPWEEREVQKATRKFADDQPPPVPLVPVLDLQATGLDEFEVAVEPGSPTPTSAIKTDDTPWSSFGSVNKNAWDNVSGIGDYVRALTASQKTRDKVQVSRDVNAPTIFSPTDDPEPADIVARVKQRRESLLLTDFPSAVERPSLPVTPAPIRRPKFWGGERDEEGDLPGANGVPDQADWDPIAQLEQLRRSSLIEPMEIKLPDKAMRQRGMPASAQPIPEEHLHEHSHTVTTSGRGSNSYTQSSTIFSANEVHESSTSRSAVSFSEPGFSPRRGEEALLDRTEKEGGKGLM